MMKFLRYLLAISIPLTVATQEALAQEGGDFNPWAIKPSTKKATENPYAPVGYESPSHAFTGPRGMLNRTDQFDRIFNEAPPLYTPGVISLENFIFNFDIWLNSMTNRIDNTAITIETLRALPRQRVIFRGYEPWQYEEEHFTNRTWLATVERAGTPVFTGQDVFIRSLSLKSKLQAYPGAASIFSSFDTRKLAMSNYEDYKKCPYVTSYLFDYANYLRTDSEDPNVVRFYEHLYHFTKSGFHGYASHNNPRFIEICRIADEHGFQRFMMRYYSADDNYTQIVVPGSSGQHAACWVVNSYGGDISPAYAYPASYTGNNVFYAKVPRDTNFTYANRNNLTFTGTHLAVGQSLIMGIDTRLYTSTRWVKLSAIRDYSTITSGKASTENHIINRPSLYPSYDAASESIIFFTGNLACAEQLGVSTPQGGDHVGYDLEAELIYVKDVPEDIVTTPVATNYVHDAFDDPSLTRTKVTVHSIDDDTPGKTLEDLNYYASNAIVSEHIINKTPYSEGALYKEGVTNFYYKIDDYAVTYNPPVDGESKPFTNVIARTRANMVDLLKSLPEGYTDVNGDTITAEDVAELTPESAELDTFAERLGYEKDEYTERFLVSMPRPAPKPMRYAGSDYPVGTILPYATYAIPPGWLPCDGSVYKKADYPELHHVLNGTWAQGRQYTEMKSAFEALGSDLDFEDYFIVPDLRGFLPIGAATAFNGPFVAGQIGDYFNGANMLDRTADLENGAAILTRKVGNSDVSYATNSPSTDISSSTLNIENVGITHSAMVMSPPMATTIYAIKAFDDSKLFCKGMIIHETNYWDAAYIDGIIHLWVSDELGKPNIQLKKIGQLKKSGETITYKAAKTSWMGAVCTTWNHDFNFTATITLADKSSYTARNKESAGDKRTIGNAYKIDGDLTLEQAGHIFVFVPKGATCTISSNTNTGNPVDVFVWKYNREMDPEDEEKK